MSNAVQVPEESARPFDAGANALDKIVLTERATQRQNAKLRELHDLGVVMEVETWAGVFDEGQILVFSKGCTRTGILHIVTVVVDPDDWRWNEEPTSVCDDDTSVDNSQ